MSIEIEKKFLVKSNEYKAFAKPVLFRQGYLSTSFERTVRVRRYDDKGFITIKGKTNNCSRLEYEYCIPIEDADNMLYNLCVQPIIEKIRYFLVYKGYEWIVDEFLGVNEGLVVAEIELKDEKECFGKPDWLGSEITSDTRYYNSNLVNNPYKTW
ncbi:CYTH domain-containing protein [Ruminiclostridium cellulolyticum]|uniref:Adenylate cyclase n=1 Tax=Ruminiclostridium cellulolyticum (strain ATCC 35319 / DSM 5812 / JCM 6584 / H10) TaxID=394503 RepID=B8I404_RUMCH|nr:CYTH domain-containing protein [Ruminiclostridium cellulolyticum]ACL76437.1 adenylate cyclase [Ruminiclostridium cellulolyticum H10]